MVLFFNSQKRLVLYDIWFSKFVDFEFRNAFFGLGRKIMKNEKIVIMSNDNLVLIVLNLQLLVVSDCCAGSRFGNGGVGLFG